jgi:hypothetical protein
VDTLKAGLVPFLQSNPGLGKSALAAQIAEESNLQLIDVRLSQMDPVDLMCLPQIDGKKATYAPMNTFPIEGDSLPVDESGNKMRGWLLLLDEFNSAPMAVQAAAYKLVLDRMVGQYKLHPKVAIIAAGNLATDKAIVNRISTAMQSRLIHLELHVDVKAFISWADAHDIDHRVKSFINWKHDALHKFDPNHNDYTFPCPRTWEFTSKLIKPMEKIEIKKLPLLAGAIGEGMAREFHAYTEVFDKIPDKNDILRDPKGITINPEPSVHFALCGLVGHHMTKANADKFMQFLTRLGIDFQVIALRAAIARNDDLFSVPAIEEWISTNADELM